MTTESSSARPGSGQPPSLWFFRHVDPIDGLTEILFGLIMVSTFTLGAGLVIGDADDATTQLAIAIVGCNLAWGFIDGALYLLSSFLERSHKARLLDSVREAESHEDALAIIGRELDTKLETITSAEERRRLYEAIREKLVGVAPEPTRFAWSDLRGAFTLFGLTVACTVPAIAPLLLISDRFVALRVSNALLLGALFMVGFRWARATHGRPWVFGTLLLVVGLALDLLAVALGG